MNILHLDSAITADASVSRQLVRAPQAADAAWGDGDLAGQPA